MFKVTFAFENGSEVEAFANGGGYICWSCRGANVAIDAPCSETEPAESVGCS